MNSSLALHIKNSTFGLKFQSRTFEVWSDRDGLTDADGWTDVRGRPTSRPQCIIEVFVQLQPYHCVARVPRGLSPVAAAAANLAQTTPAARQQLRQ